MNEMNVYRPSAILKYEDCPRSYRYQYVEGVRSAVISANLVFGTAVHEACTGYLLGKAPDPVEAFTAAWERETSKVAVEYSPRMGPEDMLATGKVLCELFPAAWKRTGLVPLVDEHGLVIERRLDMEIGDGVAISGQPDVVAMDPDGRIHVVDIKTPGSLPASEFLADQLTAYQILVEGHEDLGIDGVAGIGFMNLLKRKVVAGNRGKGPEIPPIEFEPPRSKEQIQEYRQKVLWIDEDIRKGRFPRRGRMAHNTPCGMCEYRNLCLHGDGEGLVKLNPEPETALI